jgi:hypothetical protein
MRAAARSWLDTRADAVRTLSWPHVSEVAVPPATVPPLASFDVGGVEGSVNQLVDEASRIAAATEGAINTLVGHIRQLQYAQYLLEEQQQIGWWILSSAAEGKQGWDWAFREAQALSALTRALPGPRAAAALLRRRAHEVSWAPNSDQPTMNQDALRPGFTPTLESLAGGEEPLAVVDGAADAATALYDELIFSRMTKP